MMEGWIFLTVVFLLTLDVRVLEGKSHKIQGDVRGGVRDGTAVNPKGDGPGTGGKEVGGRSTTPPPPPPHDSNGGQSPTHDASGNKEPPPQPPPEEKRRTTATPVGQGMHQHTPQPGDQSSSANNVEIIAIAGGVGGCVLLAAVAIGICIFCIRRQRTSRRDAMHNNEDYKKAYMSNIYNPKGKSSNKQIPNADYISNTLTANIDKTNNKSPSAVNKSPSAVSGGKYSHNGNIYEYVSPNDVMANGRKPTAMAILSGDGPTAMANIATLPASYDYINPMETMSNHPEYAVPERTIDRKRNSFSAKDRKMQEGGLAKTNMVANPIYAGQEVGSTGTGNTTNGNDGYLTLTAGYIDMEGGGHVTSYVDPATHMDVSEENNAAYASTDNMQYNEDGMPKSCNNPNYGIE